MQSYNHNLSQALAATPAFPFLCKPTHSICHNLCTHTPPPQHYSSLLKLGLNYCLRPRRTMNPTQFDSMNTRFRKDIYTKSIFASNQFYANRRAWDPSTLFIRSDTWDPENAHPISGELKAITSLFFRSLHQAFFPHNRRLSSPVNLGPIQQQVLTTLQDSTTHVVLPADKNLGPVIIERDRYILTALDMLSDTATYQPLSQALALQEMSQLETDLQEFLSTYTENNILDEDDLTYLTWYASTSTDPFSHFYITAKIHKTPWKPRPIVSYCGSLLYGLGKWLDKQLQPIAQQTAAYISSSFDLCNSLHTLKIDCSTDTLFTADANSMYTNIDTAHALSVFRHFFHTNELCQSIHSESDMILDALGLLMNNNLFQFGDTYWKQTDGTAMGAPPAPAYATLYFAIHEFHIQNQFGSSLLFYRRYIDDAFAIWRSPTNNPIADSTNWHRFKQAMNTFGSLTWEVEDRSTSVNFMDLTISIEHSRLTTKIFEKAQNLYLYLPLTSCHTPGILKGTIIGMIYRYYALTTKSSDLISQIELFFHRLCNRGHNPSALKPLFEEAIQRAPKILAKSNRHCKSAEPSTTESTCTIHVPFHPSHPTGKQIQVLFRDIMLSQKHIGPLPSIRNHDNWPIQVNKLRIVNHRARNLKDCLFPRKFAKRPGPSVSSYLPPNHPN